MLASTCGSRGRPQALPDLRAEIADLESPADLLGTREAQ
jgi:hypothetical protein